MSLDPKDLLIADLEHFGESLWRNEEMGEKRLTFFITLVTAVSSGLTALAAAKFMAPEEMRLTAAVALLVLLVLGLVTYLRMLKRNRVTDQYKAKLKAIRLTYVALCAPGDAALAGHEKLPPEPGLKLPGGGYAETVATMNGLLLAGLLIVAPSGWGWPLAAGAGLVLIVALWALAARSRG